MGSEVRSAQDKTEKEKINEQTLNANIKEEHELNKEKRQEGRKVNKLEREVTDAKRKEQEALQDQEVDATGKVDAERLQEEKERVEAEKSDASSKVAEAQEKAK